MIKFFTSFISDLRNVPMRSWCVLFSLLSLFLFRTCLQENLILRFSDSHESHPEYFPWSATETLNALNVSPPLDSASVEEKSLYGVEGNSTFLECVPRSPQAELRWTVQRHTGSSQPTEDRVSLNQETFCHQETCCWCLLFRKKNVPTLTWC